MLACVFAFIKFCVPSSAISSSSSSSSPLYESSSFSSGSWFGFTLFRSLMIQILYKIEFHFIFIQTPMSTISNKMKYETQSRSRINKKQVNSSGSYERRSDYQSTTSEFSENQKFEISTATLMPLILRVKEENQHFKEQKELLKKEMECLESFSKNVLIENQQLRNHYHERSSDLQKILDTMTFNVNEDLSDTNHQIYSYREWNRMIIRNIDKMSKQMKEVDGSLRKVDKMLTDTRGNNVQIQSLLRSKQVRRKELENKINSLKREQDRINLEELQKSVCELTLSCKSLKEKNMATLKFLQEEKHQISEQKPIATHNTIEAIKSIQILTKEQHNLANDLHREQLKAEELKEKKERDYEKLKQLKRNQQKLTLKLSDLTSTKTTIIEKIQKAKERQKMVNIPQRESKQYEKNKLQKELITKKQALLKKQKIHEENKHQIEMKFKKNVEKVKEKIEQTEKSYDKMIEKELNPEMITQQNRIAELLQEEVSVEEQIKTLQRNLQKLENPLKQILKLEYTLKRKNK